MTVNEHPGDDLIAYLAVLQEEIRGMAFPALAEEEVTDDGETYTALRCPRCGMLAGEGNLAAVDLSERWSYADEPDDDAFDHQHVTFNHGDDNYGDTIYYLHNDDHAVSLPDGWTESWT